MLRARASVHDSAAQGRSGGPPNAAAGHWPRSADGPEGTTALPNPQSSQGERKRLKNWRRRFRRDGNERQGNCAGCLLASQDKKGVFLHLRSKLKGISLRVMKVKEKKSTKEQVPFDPILFAVTVPSRQPTIKDRADAKERADDAIEPKDHATMDAVVEDL
jgi:hypothetical protein